MGRVYTASVSEVAVSAAQDLFEITAPATGMVRILSARWGQSSDAGDAAAELLPFNITRYASTGSGGSTPTPVPHSVGHAATGVTVEANNTTQGTTPTVLMSDAWNVQAGYLYQPPPEEQILVPPSGLIAIEFPSAPADAITISASVTFEELD